MKSMNERMPHTCITRDPGECSGRCWLTASTRFSVSLPGRSLCHLRPLFSASQKQTSRPQLQGSNTTGLSQSEQSMPTPPLRVQIEGKDFNVTEEEGVRISPGDSTENPNNIRS